MKAIESIMKAKTDITSFINSQNNTSPLLDDENFLNTRRIIKRLCKEEKIEVPSFISECRSIEEAVDELFSDGSASYIQINYINKQFNKFIDYLEDRQFDVQIVHVECEVPEELTFEHILESIAKCENRINTKDYSGAVTSAKTLVEGVCKEILHKFPDVTIGNKTDLPQLFTKVRQKLNLDPGDPKLDKQLKEVISGLIKIVNGISEVRNSYGDSHLSNEIIKEHHSLVVVNSAKTVVTFLFKTYEYQLERGILVIA
ncbi:abortive infection family protein [Peribacillus sp. YIM B13482]|uniref:abortive infection family protein n=1 Tax=Peribacillus sp. YIM B13482 TaxID=3366298 RepID=UPI00366D8606